MDTSGSATRAMVERAARLLLGAAAGAAGLRLALFAGWLLLDSFSEEYPEARFAARQWAAIGAYYAGIYLTNAVALLRRGRPPRWVVLLGALGFLTPALDVVAQWLHLRNAIEPPWFPLHLLVEAVWEFCRPPFTVLHAVLYGCAAPALAALWLRRRSAQLRA